MLLGKLLLVLELLCAGNTCVWHDTSTGVTVPVPPGVERATDLPDAGARVDFVRKACANQDHSVRFIRDPVTNRKVRNGCYGTWRP